jgi:hypothetical protein
MSWPKSASQQLLVANLLISDAYVFRACISASQEELQTRHLSAIS